MKRIRASQLMVLLAALTLACLIVHQPLIGKAEASKIVNLPLTFHGYSVVLKASNNSFIVYNGADGAAPSATGATQATLESQISGQRDGWSYWSAIIMWAIPLQSDVHVQGTVNVHAYISSTFSLSGLLSGGSYGMGIVDIDENSLEVKEFITEGPVAIGRNPFTAEPAMYSLDVNVDYVFRKGHSIGIAVGFGATVQGFSATVYFDSPSRNSGATLPVEEVSQTQSFGVEANGTTHSVSVTSNSAVSNFQFDTSSNCIKFKATGISYTSGYCDVWIPKTLMQEPFTVSMGAQQLTPTTSENSTHSHLYFTHARTSDLIQIAATSIVPEYTFIILIIFIVGSLAVTTFFKLRKPKLP